jgi:hypothetical protein
MIIGILLMAVSVAVVWYTHTTIGIRGSIYDLWLAFKTLVLGIVPALIFIIGLFVVWLEIDEFKIEKELAAEEKKAKRAKRK